MRKLRLNLQELQVESFSLESPHSAPGTVRGHDSIEVLYPDMGDGGGGDWGGGGGGGGAYTVGTCIGPTFCCPPTWRPTCANTCYNTCAFTCDGPGGVCQIP